MLSYTINLLIVHISTDNYMSMVHKVYIYVAMYINTAGFHSSHFLYTFFSFNEVNCKYRHSYHLNGLTIFDLTLHIYIYIYIYNIYIYIYVIVISHYE